MGFLFEFCGYRPYECGKQSLILENYIAVQFYIMSYKNSIF